MTESVRLSTDRSSARTHARDANKKVRAYLLEKNLQCIHEPPPELNLTRERTVLMSFIDFFRKTPQPAESTRSLEAGDCLQTDETFLTESSVSTCHSSQNSTGNAGDKMCNFDTQDPSNLILQTMNQQPHFRYKSYETDSSATSDNSIEIPDDTWGQFVDVSSRIIPKRRGLSRVLARTVPKLCHVP